MQYLLRLIASCAALFLESRKLDAPTFFMMAGNSGGNNIQQIYSLF
jgi:hypothetical protein